MAKKFQTITKTKINPRIVAGVIILIGVVGLSFIGASLLSTGVTLVNSNVNDSSKSYQLTCGNHNGQNDLIAWYKFDGDSNDYSGNNFMGIASGTPAFALGIPGQGYQFDGINDYIALPFKYCGNQHLINGLTTCAWFSTTENTGGNYDNWAFIDFDRTQYFSFFITPSGKIGFSTHSASDNNSINDFYSTATVGSPTLNDGQVHFACAVYNQGNKLIYIDGKKNARTYAHKGKPLSSTADRWGFIGDGSQATDVDGLRYNKYFKGMINEIRLYEKALSYDEVISLYKEVISSALDPSGQVNSKCSVSPVDSSQCYATIDNVCTSQTIEPKDNCIENFINIYAASSDSADIAAALDPEGPGAPWPPLSADLIVKYCLTDLSFTRANRPYCKYNLAAIDSLVFEISSNAAIINDKLSELGLGGAKSASGCNFESTSDCKNIGVTMVTAAASNSNIGNAVKAKFDKNAYVYCLAFGGDASKQIKREDCQALDWIAMCPATGHCFGVRCSVFTPEYRQWLKSQGITDGCNCELNRKKARPINGSNLIQADYGDELYCKAVSYFTYHTMSCASLGYQTGDGSGHDNHKNAIDFMFGGCTTMPGGGTDPKMGPITNAYIYVKDWLGNMGVIVNTDMGINVLVEATPCQLLRWRGGKSGPPQLHIDVNRSSGFFPCAWYAQNQQFKYTAGNCTYGPAAAWFKDPPSSAAIQAQLKAGGCGE